MGGSVGGPAYSALDGRCQLFASSLSRFELCHEIRGIINQLSI
jgi:hypothetical protein